MVDSGYANKLLGPRDKQNESETEIKLHWMRSDISSTGSPFVIHASSSSDRNNIKVNDDNVDEIQESGISDDKKRWILVIITHKSHKLKGNVTNPLQCLMAKLEPFFVRWQSPLCIIYHYSKW